MSLPKNPFHTLYVTERVGDVDFPSIFSPILVPYVQQLFQPGNVVLRGTQGTGKSMLLALLQTDIRLSFLNHHHHHYPLPNERCKFVGASINLSNSRAWKLSERGFGEKGADDLRYSQAAFADFLNTWVMRDLLSSLHQLLTAPPAGVRRTMGIRGTPSRVDNAIRRLSAHEACSSLLKGCSTMDSALEALKQRLRAFLDFINFHNASLPKTFTTIGEPLSAASTVFRECDVIDSDVEVIVTIDQFEELLRLEALDGMERDGIERKYGRFREIVDKLIGSRDKLVSYRVGSRPYALLGPGKSEPLRDYWLIDLDEILRRKEHSRMFLFPRFANDVLERRLAVAGHAVDGRGYMLKRVFGKSPVAKARASLCSPKEPGRVIRLDPSWPAAVRNGLVRLAASDVLSAKLGEAWVRQQTSRKNAPLDPEGLAKAVAARVWEDRERRWWKKERIPQAILQIATANKQRVPFFGDRDVVALAGDNILVFGTICQQVWECWIRTLREDGNVQLDIPFNRLRQDEGIREASNIWHQKITACPGGNRLQRMIDEIGTRLHKQLVRDVTMSYPGANGISLAERELAAADDLRTLLDDATTLGFLQQRAHTPKTLGRGRSQKWYLHQIFAPYYELTVPHTKEPVYLKPEDLRTWLNHAHVLMRKSKRNRRPPSPSDQLNLFE